MPVITTTKGELEEALLEKREGAIENDNEITTWIEYWLDGEMVHRSVHVTIKQWPTMTGTIQEGL